MQYFGRAKIVANGLTLDTMPGAKINVGGVARDPVAGDYTIGYAEKNTPSTVECEVNVSKETPLDAIRNMVGATVNFQTDVGLNFIVRNAFVTEPPELTGGEGKMSVKLAGEPAELG